MSLKNPFVTIDIGDTHFAVYPTDTALNAVRHSFNPSQLQAVTKIKLLAAALITEIEESARATPTTKERATTMAITASMWAVLTATEGL